MKRLTSPGFTLVEVLVALGIFGIMYMCFGLGNVIFRLTAIGGARSSKGPTHGRKDKCFSHEYIYSRLNLVLPFIIVVFTNTKAESHCRQPLIGDRN